MREGEAVGPYLIVTQPTLKGGSSANWAVGTWGREHFFIKEYLTPTYPSDEAPGSLQTKEAMRAQCRRFVRRLRLMASRIPTGDEINVNIVRTVDVLRQGPRFYSITEYVEDVGLPPMSGMTARQILILLRGLASALSCLHGVGIVHGDVRVENVLVARESSGTLVVKLIDTLDGFLLTSLPEPDQFACAIGTAAPEALDYKNGHVGKEVLSPALDVYGFGLWSTRLLELEASGLSSMSDSLAELLTSCLDPDPLKRPRIAEVIRALNSFSPLDFGRRLQRMHTSISQSGEEGPW